MNAMHVGEPGQPVGGWSSAPPPVVSTKQRKADTKVRVILVVVFGLFVFGVFYLMDMPRTNPEDTVRQYLTYLSEGDAESARAMLTTPLVDEELPLVTNEGLVELAQVSMTHTYYGYKQIERAEFWEELDSKSLEFTQDYMEGAEISDLDLLVQLADNMGHPMGVMTISDRFSDVLIRHGIRSAGDHLRELFRIKQYFDKKAGINIYELFRDEIIRTTMMEPNGMMREKQNVTDETEESL